MTRSLGFGSAALVSLTLLWTPEAAAQNGPADFGKKGQFVISGERLFGLVVASQTTTQEPAGPATDPNDGEVKTTRSYTAINLLVNPSTFLATTYAIPRIGFDYLPIDGLSVGGSVGFFTASGEVEQEANGVSQTEDTTSFSLFLLSPRVGYAFMFTPVFGIWPRGGVTFLSLTSEAADGSPKSSSSRFALTLEVPFVITPVPHVGFTFAPTLDLGLAGSDKVTTIGDMGVETSVENDATATDIGIQAGLFVYF
jgi:hypothetical protein